MDGKVCWIKWEQRGVKEQGREKRGGGWFNWEQSKAEQGSQTAADVGEQEGSGEKDEKQGNI